VSVDGYKTVYIDPSNRVGPYHKAVDMFVPTLTSFPLKMSVH